MSENIFKQIETEKEFPVEIKKDVLEKIQELESGKEPSHSFTTKSYGKLNNFFKLKGKK